MKYSTDIPLHSPNDDASAKNTFLRWIWYAARREGLHLDEADDGFSSPEEVAEAIRTVVAPTLRLSAEQQQQMVAHSAIERYGAGELIQAHGTVPEAMSFIVAGSVMLTADAEDGSRTEVATLEEGSFLGQSTLIRHPVAGSAFAFDEVTVVRVHRDAIERVVQRSPVLLQEFGRSIDERRASVLRALADAEPEDTVTQA
jgi:CRP-like cAMP-binding protein